MRYVDFGPNGIKASELILGLMRITSMSASDVASLIQAAVSEGINFIDTAAIYGDGVSEQLIGEAFSLHPGLRDKVYVQTKAGIRRHKNPSFNYFDFSKKHLLESVDASLKNLQTDHIDSLLLHRPDALMEPEEVAEAFDELKTEGKVLNFGVSNQNPMMMERLSACLNVPLVANQVQLSVAFCPAIEAGLNVNRHDDSAQMRDGGILEYGAMHDQVIQAWSVMQKPWPGGAFLGDGQYSGLNAALDKIAEAHNTNPAAVAIAWVLRHPAKMQAVIGTTKLERVQMSAQACDFELSREEWYEIYSAGGRRIP